MSRNEEPASVFHVFIFLLVDLSRVYCKCRNIDARPPRSPAVVAPDGVNVSYTVGVDERRVCIGTGNMVRCVHLILYGPDESPDETRQLEEPECIEHELLRHDLLSQFLDKGTVSEGTVVPC